ncbi:extracellular solute-binding protein [Candidatus Bathyarchaeota archaeon]|nr:extracellular solute-binding protein [Candidatus Bathyarchaeota archaeon]
MDRKALYGVLLIVILGIGAVYMWTRPQPPGPNDGENGELPEPPDGGEEPPEPTNGGTDNETTNGGEPPTASASISGIVNDNDGDPLEGVLIEAGAQTATTGADGSYELEVDLGDYVIEVSKTDYSKSLKSISITETTAYSADFTLKYSPSASGVGNTLKIITRHGANILAGARKSFLASDYAKDYEITAIRWIPIGPTLWVDTIRNSGDVDIGWGGGPVLFDTVNDAGFLKPLSSEGVLAAIDEIPYETGGVPTRRIIDDKVYWSGSAVASFGFTINTQVLSSLGLPEPTKWSDLANETYAVTLPDPIVGTADATKSTSNTRMFTIILQAYGWQDGWGLLVRKGANAKIYDQSGLVRDAAIRGDIGVGTTIDFYGYTAQLKNPEFCKYIMPADGTIVNVDPIALLTTSPQPEAAQAFIEWMLSTEGQKIWLDTNINRLPMRPEVFNTPEGLTRGDLKEVYEATNDALIIEFSDVLALSYESAMINFYHAIIVRPQLTLVDVWMAMTTALEEGDITRAEFMTLVGMLGNPHLIEFQDMETGEMTTFTQEYAQSIAARIAVDPEYKQILVDRWVVAAENHYSDAMAELDSLTS